jgi:uncharacterized C2H2 Zn-finger protein
MSKTSKRVTPDSDTVFGPSTVDNSSGELSHPLQDDSVPSHAIIERGEHSMKGILGVIRGRSYKESSYQSGDLGGSAGGYGAEHGMLSSTMQGMKGDGIGFEGGVRGGGVSILETLPSQPRVPKKGFDEHNRRSGAAPTHGVPGVEGFSDDSAGDEGAEANSGSDGLVCPHGCGMVARSSHGLARHIHKRHGGFGGLGKAFGKKEHGTSYKGEELRGETEGASQWKSIRAEFDQAQNKAESGSVMSSYVSGDAGGSYTKMKAYKGV